ncbi:MULTISPECIES: hypothetical protein [unclassified Oleiphilus]|nr:MULTISPECIES: hypothetical protein [unclassified Oleiphilus]
MAITNVSNANNFSIMIASALFLIEGVVGTLLLVGYLNYHQVQGSRLLCLLVDVIALQALFVVIYFVSPSFKELAAFLVPAEESNVKGLSALIRSRGLTHSASATLSLVQASGGFILLYLIALKQIKRPLWIVSLALLLIVISVILTGRTGIILLALGFIGGPLVAVLSGRLTKNMLRILVAAPILLFSGLLALNFLYTNLLGGFQTSWGQDGFDYMLTWATREFTGGGGGSRFAILEALQRMWIFPVSDMGLFFGDPSSWGNIPSDVGIVRLLNATGMIGTLFFYVPFLLLFLFLVRGAGSYTDKVFLGLLVFFLILAEFKEPFLLKLYVIKIVIIIFCATQQEKILKRN